MILTEKEVRSIQIAARGIIRADPEDASDVLAAASYAADVDAALKRTFGKMESLTLHAEVLAIVGKIKNAKVLADYFPTFAAAADGILKDVPTRPLVIEGRNAVTIGPDATKPVNKLANYKAAWTVLNALLIEIEGDIAPINVKGAVALGDRPIIVKDDHKGNLSIIRKPARSKKGKGSLSKSQQVQALVNAAYEKYATGLPLADLDGNTGWPGLTYEEVKTATGGADFKHKEIGGKDEQYCRWIPNADSTKPGGFYPSVADVRKVNAAIKGVSVPSTPITVNNPSNTATTITGPAAEIVDAAKLALAGMVPAAPPDTGKVDGNGSIRSDSSKVKTAV